jgi:hypothetical protein
MTVMFMSRHLEKPRLKTKFRKQAEEEVVEKQKKKLSEKKKKTSRPGFDMWEDEANGC